MVDCQQPISGTGSWHCMHASCSAHYCLCVLHQSRCLGCNSKQGSGDELRNSTNCKIAELPEGPEMQEEHALNLVFLIFFCALLRLCFTDQLTYTANKRCTAEHTEQVIYMLCSAANIAGWVSPTYSNTSSPCLACCFAIKPQPFGPKCLTLHAQKAT